MVSDKSARHAEFQPRECCFPLLTESLSCRVSCPGRHIAVFGRCRFSAIYPWRKELIESTALKPSLRARARTFCPIWQVEDRGQDVIFLAPGTLWRCGASARRADVCRALAQWHMPHAPVNFGSNSNHHWSTMLLDEPSSSPQSILYQNQERTLVLLDLPSSIEESQTLRGQVVGKRRRLVSTAPPKVPFEVPKPKDGKENGPSEAHASASALVAELMTQMSVERALNELNQAYAGPWCLPRHTLPSIESPSDTSPATCTGFVAPGIGSSSPHFIPDGANHLLGSIHDQRYNFLAIAHQFDVIVMDPPWPNRSARRKERGNPYRPADDIAEMQELLSLIPVAAKLAPDGVVAVWVTNRRSVVNLLCKPGGIFDQWGVQLLQESVWLKIAANGEPIFPVESRWRKPWERFLMARPKTYTGQVRKLSFPEVIVAVPELHSRKPNLRYLFEQASLPRGDYRCLEIFARNLTAGWWSWGSEVLLFQAPQYWAIEQEEGAEKHSAMKETAVEPRPPGL
jgi:N6-adenosine-specific RNA methylase IME4